MYGSSGEKTRWYGIGNKKNEWVDSLDRSNTKRKKGKISHFRMKTKNTFSIVLLIVINTGCFRYLEWVFVYIYFDCWRNVYDLNVSSEMKCTAKSLPNSERSEVCRLNCLEHNTFTNCVFVVLFMICSHISKINRSNSTSKIAITDDTAIYSRYNLIMFGRNVSALALATVNGSENNEI